MALILAILLDDYATIAPSDFAKRYIITGGDSTSGLLGHITLNELRRKSGRDAK
jgi:hypothetical protein